MSDIFWATLPATIASIGALIVAGAGAWISLRNRDGIAGIRKSTDGMKDELVAAALIAGERKGKAKEQANPTTESVPITNDSRRSSDQ